MGKVRLNYANRKPEGVKLGEIVAKDLTKRVSQFFSKLPKNGADESILSLELQLPGKRLTDDGLRALMPSLENILSGRDALFGGRLDELNLAGNDITSKGLLMLTQAIELSRFDLKVLNLSGNKITVKTEDDAHHWETFLKSFRNSRVLRYLDFSNNDLSGSTAFEVFTRVYLGQPAVDPTELNNGLEVAGNPDDDDGENSHSPGLRSSNSIVDVDLSQPMILMRRCGLRAVPYLVFNDCSMTDAGALHFSYVLPMHYYPQQLMAQSKPTATTTMLDAEAHRFNCWGLVYVPNEGLSDSGMKLLSAAEDARKDLNQSFVTPDDVSETTDDFEFLDVKQSTPAQRRRPSGFNLRHRGSTVSGGSRRESGGSDLRKGTSDLESQRRRVQRNALEQHEVAELWLAALRMLVLARTLLLRPGNDIDDWTVQVLREVTISFEPISPPHEIKPPATANSTKRPDFSVEVVDRPEGADTELPNLGQLDITTEPIASTETTATGWVAKHTAKKLSAEEQVCRLWARLSQRVGQKYLNGYCQEENLFGLFESMLTRILSYAAGAVGILSAEQQKKVMEYARDRANLAKEMEIASKGRGYQVWNVLESMGCLAYDAQY